MTASARTAAGAGAGEPARAAAAVGSSPLDGITFHDRPVRCSGRCRDHDQRAQVVPQHLRAELPGRLRPARPPGRAGCAPAAAAISGGRPAASSDRSRRTARHRTRRWPARTIPDRFTAACPPGSAISVRWPLSSTVAPLTRGGAADRGQPVGQVDVREHPGELPVVRGEHGRWPARRRRPSSSAGHRGRSSARRRPPAPGRPGRAPSAAGRSTGRRCPCRARPPRPAPAPASAGRSAATTSGQRASTAAACAPAYRTMPGPRPDRAADAEHRGARVAGRAGDDADQAAGELVGAGSGAGQQLPQAPSVIAIRSGRVARSCPCRSGTQTIVPACSSAISRPVLMPPKVTVTSARNAIPRTSAGVRFDAAGQVDRDPQRVGGVGLPDQLGGVVAAAAASPTARPARRRSRPRRRSTPCTAGSSAVSDAAAGPAQRRQPGRVRLAGSVSTAVTRMPAAAQERAGVQRVTAVVAGPDQQHHPAPGHRVTAAARRPRPRPRWRRGASACSSPSRSMATPSTARICSTE